MGFASLRKKIYICVMKLTPQISGLKQEEKEFAALSYVWVFSVMIYFSPHAKKSAYVKHHAAQGIFLFALSVIVYFLPGYLSYINVLLVFLMVLGIVEAALGNQYSLPLIGEWIKGNFHFEKYFSFFLRWGKKVFNWLDSRLHRNDNMGISIFKRFRSNPFLHKKKSNVRIHAKIKGLKRGEWDQNVKSIETMLKEIFVSAQADIIVLQQGFSASINDKEVFLFGNVNKTSFNVIYNSEEVPVPCDETLDEWGIKWYNIKKLDKKGLRALVSLVVGSV